MVNRKWILKWIVAFVILVPTYLYYIKQPDLSLGESFARKFETPKQKQKRLKKEQQDTNEQHHRTFLQQAQCVPEKPLNKGEIYAMAMQEYWQEQINRIWKSDEIIAKLKELQFVSGEVADDINTRICRLEWDKQGKPLKFGNQACFPWKITQYDTLEKIKAWGQQGIHAKNLEELLARHWQGEYYDPAKGYLYQPEFYNQANKFAVIQHNADKTLWYPKDCCRLLDYDEIQQEGIHIKFPWLKDTDALKDMKQLSFLVIKRKKIDEEVKHPSGLNQLGSQYNQYDKKYFSMVYIVNSCGKIISPPDFSF